MTDSGEPADGEEVSLAMAALGEAIRHAAMLRWEDVTIQAPAARVILATLRAAAPRPVTGEGLRAQRWRRIEAAARRFEDLFDDDVAIDGWGVRVARNARNELRAALAAAPESGETP